VFTNETLRSAIPKPLLDNPQGTSQDNIQGPVLAQRYAGTTGELSHALGLL